MFIDAEG